MKNRIGLGLAALVVAFVSVLSTAALAAHSQIVVVSPTGDIVESAAGEQAAVWCPGEVQSIMLTCNGLRGQSAQVLLINEITCDRVPVGSFDITADGGYSFDFLMPDAPLGHYRVVVQSVRRGRVTNFAVGGAVVVQESSPGPIQFTSPVSGATLVCGQHTMIKWIGAAPGDIRLQLWIGSDGNGQLFQDLGWVYATQGACSWTVNLAPGTYRYAVLLVGQQQYWTSGWFTVTTPKRH